MGLSNLAHSPMTLRFPKNSSQAAPMSKEMLALAIRLGCMETEVTERSWDDSKKKIPVAQKVTSVGSIENTQWETYTKHIFFGVYVYVLCIYTYMYIYHVYTI